MDKKEQEEKRNALNKAIEFFKNLPKGSFNSESTEDHSEAETTDDTIESTFAEVTLMDGETVLSYEGDLTAGTAVFVVGEDGEQVPAPEGEHALGGELEGVTIIVDAEGVISEVIDERETEEAETEEEMSEETEEKEEKEEFSIEDLKEPLMAIASGIETLSNENAALREELDGFKAEFKEFKDTPSVEETKKDKFNRVDDGLSLRTKDLINKRKNRK